MSSEIPDSSIKGEQASLQELLENKVVEILQKEIEGRVSGLYDRGFGYISNRGIFDFIRVGDSHDSKEEKFIMVFFGISRVNSYHPRMHPNHDFFPMGFKEESVYKVFREDLEKGKIPKKAFRQTGVRSDTEEDNHYDHYEPLCLEVTDKGDIRQIEELVNSAVNKGMREEIINKKSEDMEEILARIENDDSADFDYWDRHLVRYG